MASKPAVGFCARTAEVKAASANRVWVKSMMIDWEKLRGFNEWTVSEIPTGRKD